MSPTTKGWIGPDFKGIREAGPDGLPFDFESLPPIPNALSPDFTWLPPYLKGLELRRPEMQFLEDKKLNAGVDLSEGLDKLEQQLLRHKIELPAEIRSFLTTPSINNRIRSVFDDYFEIATQIETLPGGQGFLLHFMSDSQYCQFWYICLREDGSHFIFTSNRLYGQDDEIETEVSCHCADSFLDFIYRYNLEHRIWLKLNWFKAELTEAEQTYLDWYKRASI